MPTKATWSTRATMQEKSSVSGAVWERIPISTTMSWPGLLTHPRKHGLDICRCVMSCHVMSTSRCLVPRPILSWHSANLIPVFFFSWSRSLAPFVADPLNMKSYTRSCSPMLSALAAPPNDWLNNGPANRMIAITTPAPAPVMVPATPTRMPLIRPSWTSLPTHHTRTLIHKATCLRRRQSTLLPPLFRLPFQLPC